MNKGKVMTICLYIFVLILSACATTGTMETAFDGGAVIQSIDILDNGVNITMSGDFRYTIYKPGDPFKAIVELPDVAPGPYTEKIISDKIGITEINPVIITEPELSTKLEILLQAPSRLTPEVSDNMLSLRVEEGEEYISEADTGEARGPGEEDVLRDREEVSEVALPAEEEGGPFDDAVTRKGAPGLRITDIRFERAKDAVKVVIKANGTIKPNVFPLDRRVVLDFSNVTMAAVTPKEVAYPLKGIRWGDHKDSIRIVLDLMEKASYDVIAVENSVVVSLSAPDMIAPAAREEARPEKAEPPIIGEVPEEAPPVEEREAEPQIEEGRYVGKRISLDFQDADIIPIFRLFADVSGYNVVISPTVEGKITMKLINVPWDQALDIVLRTHNLGKQIEGNIIRIAPNSELAKESDAKAKAKDAQLKAKPLATKVFPINYAGVDRINEAMSKAKILSPRGSMTVDQRASVIIVNDVEDSFPKVQDLIDQLDRPELQVRQVLIEARIVEASTTFARDLGIQWGAFGRVNDFRLGIGGTPLSGGAGFTGNNFIVNMPAGVQTGSGGAIGLGYLNAARTFALDLQISALERTGKGKIVSNPRIITMNNTTAKITQGRTIYIPVATADKTDVKPIDAMLSLDVTPSIAPGGAVLLEIKISKDEPGDIVAGNISINRNTAETSTLINNGETVVIGGIYKNSIITGDDEVPLLAKIPLFGWLFKKKRTDETTSEVLIFITPRVVSYEES